jgi:hypothetical protein
MKMPKGELKNAEGEVKMPKGELENAEGIWNVEEEW